MRSLLVAVGLAVATVAWGHGRKAERVTVPFETLKDHRLVLLHARIGGKDGVFIFDSGADTTFVDADFAGFSDKQVTAVMERGKSLQAGSWSGAVAEGSVCLASHCFARREIGIVFRGTISKQITARRIDGIIGQDLLREFDSVTIDYKRSVLVFNIDSDEHNQ